MIIPLINLYLLSAKISLISFGGIYSFWAILNREAVVACDEAATVIDKGITFCQSEYDLVLALSPVLPGPHVNVASILGYGSYGVAGMVAILLGLLTPVILLSPVVYLVYRRYRQESWIRHFFAGTSVAVIAILVVFLGAIISRATSEHTEGTVVSVFLFLSIFVLSYKQRLSPVIAILLGAFIGVFFLQ